MAIDANDIERLKAAVPDDHQPPPQAAGSLSSVFVSSVDSLRESTPLQGSEGNRHAADELERHNLGMAFLGGGNDDAANPGFLLNGAQATMRHARTEKVEQRRRDDDRRHVIALVLSQIEARNRQIAENLQRLEELDRQETALNRHLARLRSGGGHELDEHGKLRDEEAERAVREYEDRYGVSVDRNDADQIALILQSIRDQQIQLRRDSEQMAAENESDRQLALDMGTDPKSIPETVRKLQTTEAGKRSLAAATFALASADLKQRVVDARFDQGADHALASAQVSDGAGFSGSASVALDEPTTMPPAMPPRPS
jgi:hypothetical protein